ncbi:DEAD/DEAH box helicase [Acidiphilium acidophilum]|uniref:DEAD/DEAH box helicase n=1 Tax=Acidiphilium acidophilum TaxID=76588 RepID=UPI002E8E7796|nr:DEAD/DEAH box helicase [Acidiphilium acidophilum]
MNLRTPTPGTFEPETVRSDFWDAPLQLTPSGHLRFVENPHGRPSRIPIEIIEAFKRGTGNGLLWLGTAAIDQPLPPVLGWWRGFAHQYIAATRLKSAGREADLLFIELPETEQPVATELSRVVLTAPIMPGAEYITPALLGDMWISIGFALHETLQSKNIGLNAYLHSLNPAWSQLGRVHFNLAENKRDTDTPFAFMATYTTRLSAQSKAQHLPLGQALRDYADQHNREKLLSLLMPVQRAAERCAWLRPLIESGEIYHPLRWKPAEAAQLLASADDLEQTGILLRMPATWHGNRPPRPRVTATIGSREPSTLGLDGLLDFQMDVTLDGDVLTLFEIKQLLAGTDQLILLRGKWVEIDRDRLKQAMAKLEAAETLAADRGLSFTAAMRLLTGMDDQDAADQAPTRDWAEVIAGPWLSETLRALRTPAVADLGVVPGLCGNLRPYQQEGVIWLRLLTGLRLGACLADDMGLGKTIQVISLLLGRKNEISVPKPSILVVPASLLANWASEIRRFAPSLSIATVHPSAMSTADMKNFGQHQAAHHDVVMTTYATLIRLPRLMSALWRYAILDEAQAIKNPVAKQTRAVKTLRAEARIALTGTPVENSLSDLWSIFDFINPGLLGNAKYFSSYIKGLQDRTDNPYGPLRNLVRPYILRRMKTDKAIIADLPDKTEVTAHCLLSRKQAALYAEAVENLTRSLEDADGIQRRGLILSSLMRLKQICNHPSQWLNDHRWHGEESGKFIRLREIAEEIAARQEKMIIFTQFREMTTPLADHLAGVFGREGLILHGGTPVRQRKSLVTRFQEDDTIPFFVLSLKAGGVGLTLTSASHVVHFDRWWNPAVENQATDRAFRIGQKSSVLVHKFVCRGTVEEKIDRLIESKRALSADLLSGADEVNVTTLSDDALIDLVSLDLAAVAKE